MCGTDCHFGLFDEVGVIYDALHLWAIAQDVPTSKHEHVNECILSKLSDDNLHNESFGFIQVVRETPEHSKEHFSEMTTIFIMLRLHLMI